MTIQPLDFKSIKSYLILTYVKQRQRYNNMSFTSSYDMSGAGPGGGGGGGGGAPGGGGGAHPAVPPPP